MKNLIQNLKFISKQYRDGNVNEKKTAKILQKSIEKGSALLLQDFLKIRALLPYSAEELLYKDLRTGKKLSNKEIKLVIFDMDGTLTDGSIIYTENGDELKQFNAKDGLAIRALTKNGYETAILSHAITHQLVKKRATVLHCKRYYCGKEDKVKIIESWLKESGYSWKQLAYVGDDINDLEVMKKTGFSACPSDASPEIKKIAQVVLKTAGGKGCIREMVDEYFI